MHDRTQGNLIFNTVFNNPALVMKPSISGDNLSNLPALRGAAEAGLTSPLGGMFGAERSGKVPTVYSFSLGIQQELGWGTTLDMAYVGTMSRHLVTSRDINAIPYGFAFTKAAQDPDCFGGTVPDVEPGLPAAYSAAGFNFTGRCALGRNAYTNAPLVPYKGYGEIAYLGFGGTSNYNSLQVSLQRRFAQGLTFGTAYTWSKSLTTANGDEDTTDPYYPLLDYRAASWDRRHVFALNYVYELPSITRHLGGPKWLSVITDGFQISGVTQFMTGTPIDLNNGWSFESGAIDGSNMWGKIPYYYQVDSNGDPIAPGIGIPARGSRDFYRTGGLQNWDMSLFKNFRLGEQRSVQLRLEAFNVFNHPNFANPSNPNDPAELKVVLRPSSQFGTATHMLNNSLSPLGLLGQLNPLFQIGGPRTLQFAWRLRF
jgi:hypothetical protein